MKIFCSFAKEDRRNNHDHRSCQWLTVFYVKPIHTLLMIHREWVVKAAECPLLEVL